MNIKSTIFHDKAGYKALPPQSRFAYLFWLLYDDDGLGFSEHYGSSLIQDYGKHQYGYGPDQYGLAKRAFWSDNGPLLELRLLTLVCDDPGEPFESNRVAVVVPDRIGHQAKITTRWLRSVRDLGRVCHNPRSWYLYCAWLRSIWLRSDLSGDPIRRWMKGDASILDGGVALFFASGIRNPKNAKKGSQVSPSPQTPYPLPNSKKMFPFPDPDPDPLGGGKKDIDLDLDLNINKEQDLCHVTLYPDLDPGVGLPEAFASPERYGRVSWPRAAGGDYTAEFERFWRAYPRRDGSKAKAFKAWCNITQRPPLDLLLKSIVLHKQTEQWRTDNGRYIPHASTWLNQRRWEAEVQPSAKPIPKGEQILPGYHEIVSKDQLSPEQLAALMD